MLGTSGTVTTLAGVHLGLARYDRSVVDGCYLDFATIQSISRSLAATDCRSEEHTSELQSLMRISYAVFCLKKKKHRSEAQPIEHNTQQLIPNGQLRS